MHRLAARQSGPGDRREFQSGAVQARSHEGRYGSADSSLQTFHRSFLRAGWRGLCGGGASQGRVRRVSHFRRRHQAFTQEDTRSGLRPYCSAGRNVSRPYARRRGGDHRHAGHRIWRSGPMTAVIQRKADLLSAEIRTRIDRWVAKYPVEQKRSACMAALRIVQEVHGWLSTELMDAVADYLEMEPISVYEVATFYSMYDLKPMGRHKVAGCTNVSCMLCGSSEIMKNLEEKLGVKAGQTTPVVFFLLFVVVCLAACVGAPMMQVGKTFHEHLTPAKIDAILGSLE